MESNSESDYNGARDWTKGLNPLQQMYIPQKFKKNHGYNSEDEMLHIDPDQLNALKNKHRKAEKCLKKRWEVYTS